MQYSVLCSILSELNFFLSASSASDLSAPSTPNVNKSRVNASPSAADSTAVTIDNEDDSKLKSILSKKEKKQRESKADLYR